MSKWLYGNLPRSVYFLFVARIINRFGDFVRFFLTLYLTRILQMDEKTTGLIVTLSAVAIMLGSLGGGKLGDSIGHKPVMLLSQCISASILFVCGFFLFHSMLTSLLIASQLFLGAIRPVSQALLIDLTPPERRQQAFSLLYLGINIGVAVGPMVAGFLFENFRHWIFWGDAITSFIGVFLIWRFVPKTRAETAQKSEETAEASVEGPSVTAFLKRPILAAFTAVTLFTTLVYAQHNFSLPLLLNEIFAAKSARFFGIIMSVNAVTVVVFTPLILKLMNRRPPALNMVWGGVAYAAGFGMLPFTGSSMFLFLLSTVIWTWGEIVFATNVNVFVSVHTPVNHRGRFSAIRNLVLAGGQALAPLLGGFIIGAVGVRGIWYPVFALALV